MTTRSVENSLFEVTETQPSGQVVRTAKGRMLHRTWCLLEVSRLRESGVDAGLHEYGQPGRLVCCVVRADNQLHAKPERR